MKEKNIKPILKKFLILPKQAIRGTLSDIRPIGDVWTIENTSKFVSMILEKVLFGKVLKLSKEVRYFNANIHLNAGEFTLFLFFCFFIYSDCAHAINRHK